MNKIKFSVFKPGWDLLKEKRFWIFFIVQFLFWTGFYFWQIREIVDLTSLISGRERLPFFFHLINFFLLSSPIIIVQILSTIVLPRIKFWQVVLIILSNYFNFFGLLVALILFLFQYFNPKKFLAKVLFMVLSIIISSLISIVLFVVFFLTAEIVYKFVVV
ncbi:MAG: hypothetical protein UW63_C0008G0020 [Candidatus Uhrbacteria bacterium GW2011_GWF2_44_350]|uniref:Yip1 domain-containing protein n=1 Tax=Candidatus Uhrbacteria bacterium GW2011_GWF2_44_350 TaxID=1619000 RepID=A0A0G1MII2_9BACT|nr:MAG: hypothetical protein UW63_C0008G0020 [Candidatus Uhrbacteria bacterium GW2011_GWF2_44_350]HBR80744.1 hypothetical protein [Candidatus Uhrbacteria bacterium]